MIISRSIGIIGGADGPTAIFVTGGFPWEVLLLGCLFIGAIFWLIEHKK